ncbi:MAG: adenylate kinase [Candidatus Omnitrophica bacterium]|nr:adenylate kinase [Candidatus Omnitrophota bacterium]
MKLVLLGPPGAGKGTLAAFLNKKLDIPHVSTGDMLREEMKNNTLLGQEVKHYVESGGLVPDQVVIKLIENKFSHDKAIDKGYMLDGFPRTKVQAKDLDILLNGLNKPVDYAVYLDASLPVIVERLTGRRICRHCSAIFHVKNNPPKKEGICNRCGGEIYQRPDDNEETIKTRMSVYLKNTKPVIDYYEAQGKLKKVDADRNSQEVQESLMKIVHSIGEHERGCC